MKQGSEASYWFEEIYAENQFDNSVEFFLEKFFQRFTVDKQEMLD